MNVLEALEDSESLNRLLLRLPYRHPALLIDRITYLEPNKFIAAIKNITRNEPAFTGIDANNYYPSTLVLESLIQTCSILATHELIEDKHTSNQNLLSGITKAEFYGPVIAGDQLLLTAEVKCKKPYIWVFESTAMTEEYKVAVATITFKNASIPNLHSINN